jgi:glucose/mannose-6-phosphate isomerase
VTRPQYLDTMGVWASIASGPEYLSDAIGSANEVLAASSLPSSGQVASVVLLGTGMAETAARAVQAVAAAQSPLSLSVEGGGTLPQFVGPSTLVIALAAVPDSSVTVAVAQAQDRGASVIGLAPENLGTDLPATPGWPAFTLPSDLVHGWGGLGAMVAPVLLTLHRMGLVADPVPALGGAGELLKRRRDLLAEVHGPAVELARRIGRTIPLIYGSAGVGAVAARHWKAAVNANAKTPAFSGDVPTVSHGEVAGWGQHGDVTRQVFTLVSLRHAGEDPLVAESFARVLEATDEVMADLLPVQAEGVTDVARFLDLAQFGDFVSLHLAGRENIDPGPTPALSEARPS